MTVLKVRFCMTYFNSLVALKLLRGRRHHENNYSQTCLQQTCYIGDTCNNRHFFVELAKSQSNSHRKPLIQRIFLQQTIVLGDTTFQHPKKSSSQIYLFTVNTTYFCWKIEINCYSIFKCFYLTHVSEAKFLLLSICKKCNQQLFPGQTTQL